MTTDKPGCVLSILISEVDSRDKRLLTNLRTGAALSTRIGRPADASSFQRTSGAVVPGIRVTATSVSTNVRSATVTDAKPVAVATRRLPKDATTNSSDSYRFTQQKDNSLTFEFANGTTLILSSPHEDGSRQGKA